MARGIRSGVLACLLVSSAALAQERSPVATFTELPGVVNPGDRIRLVTVDGRWITGLLLRLDDEAIEIEAAGQPARWSRAEILELQRQTRDRIWDGALRGAAIAGGLAASVLVGGGCVGETSCSGTFASNVVAMSLLGFIIDRRVKPFRVVYLRDPAQSPAIRLSRGEVTIGLGAVRLDLAGGRYPNHAAGHPPGHEPAVAVAGAVRWSRHWMTEAEVSCLCHNRRDTFDVQIVETQASTRSIYYSHTYKVVRLAVGQLYEPGPARRLQPYLGLAIGAEVQRIRDSRTEYTIEPLTPIRRDTYLRAGTSINAEEVTPAEFIDRRSSQHVYAFGRAGLKAAASEHALIVFEVRAGKRAGSVRLGMTTRIF